MPRFAHFCDRCEFLATVGPYDLYACQDSSGDSLIARYGDEPSEYASLCDFRQEIQATIRRETGGLTDTQVKILAAFRLMPTLLLNMATTSIEGEN